jgi:NTE family protein
VLGLVLSGGGLFGAAHVGVLEGLAALGVTPDLVVGTSAGALVGGLWAAGVPARDLHAITAELTGNELPFDWRGVAHALLQRRGLPDRIISDRPLYRRLEALVGSIPVDETARPVWITATSLTSRRVVLFGRHLEAPLIDTGTWAVHPWPHPVPLVTAMRASIAVPGLFRPVVLGGEVLVDGGVLNDYPLDVALLAGATRYIGVRILDRTGDTLAAHEPPDVLSAAVKGLSLLLEEAAALRSRLVEDRFRVPGIELAVSAAGIGMTDFLQLGRLIELGRQQVEAHREEILGLATV